MDNINGIELNRKHRFLDLNTSKEICDSWSAYFIKKNVPHKTEKTMHGWTIYKHMIIHMSERHKRSYCCEQGANYFRTAERRQETEKI